ncbi:unnamed protein product [Boreogadus saida]
MVWTVLLCYLLSLVREHNTVDPSPLFRGHVFENSAAASKVIGLSVPMKRINVPKRCPDSGFHMKLSGNGSEDFVVVAHHKRGNVLLKTSRVLDREKRSEYLLSLGLCCQTCASERVSFEVATLKVVVLDTNDHPPAFENTDIHISLQDTTALRSVVYKAEAVDEDVGKNSELTYTSMPQNGSFYVVPKTGEVLLVDSILGLPSKVVFTIFARDHGLPPLTSKGAVVTITPHRWARRPVASKKPGGRAQRSTRALLDVGTVVSLNVSEDASVGSVITTLGAVNRFHAATYELIYPGDSEGSPVTVGRDSGDIVIARRLDRESEPFVELTVKIQDKRGLLLIGYMKQAKRVFLNGLGLFGDGALRVLVILLKACAPL